MIDQYSALLSGLIGAVVGAGASVAVVWIQGREWLRQQRWGNRERHYVALLSNLTRLKLSLQDRSVFFGKPGSADDTSRSESEEFQRLSREGEDALRDIREQIGAASIYLSTNTTKTLESMLSELWHAAEGSVCTADYVNTAVNLVDAAYLDVLCEARRDLGAARGT